ncbi:MAG: PhnD/SsuA/transferrin family substrate-binding protein [Chitinophagaceae bacterium]|uniref:phosphate/phosphite/phosphonate ABC transporter substrate-binding protein n=1 Tax=unclassified Paraflavitalea TaxID=2798305 RepID=UPI003D352C41|nr:PhnD/SsuA/transferrin family substrate-binding protein [Chitinophagaceae bacterium]
MPLTYKASYYPWITQNIDAKIIHANINILLRKTEEELAKIASDKVTIELLPALEVPQQMKAIITGDCQIAFMNPLGFIYANEVNPSVNACSIVERKINDVWGKTYFAQVYVNKKTGFKKDIFNLPKIDYQKRIKGKSIGFGTPFSTSNFIIPAFELKKKGLNILSTFNRLEFWGGHELAAKAVYDGKVDLGAGHDGVISDLANQYGYGDADEKLITIMKSSEIPSDPIAVNLSNHTEFKNLQVAFENASKTKEGEDAIKIFWGGARHLLPGETNVYKYLIEAAKDLGLTREDIFGE